MEPGLDAPTALASMGITRWLGITVVDPQPADAWAAEMRTVEAHLNLAGVVHGGILATLIDAAGGFGAEALVGRSGLTTDLHVRFLSAAFAGTTLRAAVTLDRSGRTATVVTVRVTDRGNEGRLVALATVDFTVLDRGTPP